MNHSLSLFLLSLWLFTLCRNASTYSQISAYGGSTNDEGPKIFKSTNADLVFPVMFNQSTNTAETTSSPLPSISPQSLSPQQYGTESQAAVPNPQPLIFVTPPTPEQASPAQQIPNQPAMESNQMSGTTKNDFSMQSVQQTAHENLSASASQNRQQQVQQQAPYIANGRAVDYRPAQQLEQFANGAVKRRPSKGRPYSQRPANSYAMRPQKPQFMDYGRGKLVPYPTYRQQQYQRRPISPPNVYSNAAQISDRFTPGEAVASALFAQKGHKQHQHHHHPHQNHNQQGNKLASPSNFVQSFVPSKDLYAFPPNINAKYPKPANDPKIPLPSSSINSYAPAPAGPISSNVGYPLAAAASSDSGYKYPGPVNQAYLPPNGDDDGKTKDSDNSKPIEGGDAAGNGDMEDNDDTIGVLPASAMDGGDDNKADDDAGGGMKTMDEMSAMPMSDGDHDHDHDHDHPPTGYDTGKEYPTPPPGWMEEHPDAGHFPHFSHHFPDIIYDDHHHHDFHHDHHHDAPPPPAPTTIPPPPEPLPSEQPQEPRVKKYSYFYIGRKLWYIPLYFTVWFSFYVLWLILKSIARHKVNLPNHYQSKRSLPDYTESEVNEYINELTVTVLQHIEGFQKKMSIE